MLCCVWFCWHGSRRVAWWLKWRQRMGVVRLLARVSVVSWEWIGGGRLRDTLSWRRRGGSACLPDQLHLGGFGETGDLLQISIRLFVVCMLVRGGCVDILAVDGRWSIRHRSSVVQVQRARGWRAPANRWMPSLKFRITCRAACAPGPGRDLPRKNGSYPSRRKREGGRPRDASSLVFLPGTCWSE